ncbi:MAG: RpiB/LacA/LacB family sugar-phosphate isomerase [Patescibacteria group bacterium]
MQIFIGADHRGFETKNQLVEWLESQGHQVIDLGNTTHDATDDYPDFAIPVAEQVAKTKSSLGLVICGSGVGASIAANKVVGARAGLAISQDSVQHIRQNDHVNVLALSADYCSIDELKNLITTFLNTQVDSVERHLRRISKITAYEIARS